MCDLAKGLPECIMEENKDELLCCAAARLGNSFREVWRSMAVIGSSIPEHKCDWHVPKEDT